MYRIKHRPALPFVLLLACLWFPSCEDLHTDNRVFDDSEFYKLLILPENPDSQDPILLIENTCGIEPDPLVNIEGFQINYQRNFNSLMGAPCSPQLDTTIIGPLDSGNYKLIHRVIDLNHLLKDSVISVDTLDLVIK